MGLREKIKLSETESEVDSLLKLGETYQLASEYTKRAWKSTARLRLNQLHNNVPPQPSQESHKKDVKNSSKNKKIKLRLKKS